MASKPSALLISATSAPAEPAASPNKAIPSALFKDDNPDRFHVAATSTGPVVSGER